MLIDAGFESSPSIKTEFSNYNSEFLFIVLLSYSNTNRSKQGYDIDIIVQSDNSSAWRDSLMLYMSEKGLSAILIV